MSVIFIQSVKGGSGKSLVARFVMDKFISEDKNPLLIETDSGNPDVARSYMTQDRKGKKCDVKAVRIKEYQGFAEMLDAIYGASQKNRDVVVNCAGSNMDDFVQFGNALIELSKIEKLDLITLWVLDTDRVCVEQLADFIEIMGKSTRIAIIKNLGLGEANKEKFDFLADTNTGKALPSVFFPKLRDVIVQPLKSPENKALHEVIGNLSMGTRLILSGEIKAAKAAVAEALEKAAIREVKAAVEE